MSDKFSNLQWMMQEVLSLSHSLIGSSMHWHSRFDCIIDSVSSVEAHSHMTEPKSIVSDQLSNASNRIGELEKAMANMRDEQRLTLPNLNFDMPAESHEYEATSEVVTEHSVEWSDQQRNPESDT